MTARTQSAIAAGAGSQMTRILWEWHHMPGPMRSASWRNFKNISCWLPVAACMGTGFWLTLWAWDRLHKT